MEEVLVADRSSCSILFIGLPWLIFHYVTKWKTAATLTGADEKLLDELHDAARRLDDRLCTIERIMTAENPDWRQHCLPEQRARAPADRTESETMSCTQPPSRTRFYRDKRNGKVMGVCAGIADYTGFDVTLVRIMMVAAILLEQRLAIAALFHRRLDRRRQAARARVRRRRGAAISGRASAHRRPAPPATSAAACATSTGAWPTSKAMSPPKTASLAREIEQLR